jgi:uncharacterized lipoprotein YddW (UPF0748 family)
MLVLRAGLLAFVAVTISGPLRGGALATSAPRYLAQLRSTTKVVPSDELRALWVVRDALTSPGAVEQMIDFAVQARFHLLFVQVRGRGEVYYPSRLEPPADDLQFPLAQFDPLDYTVALARAAGISVHAWINVYYVWSDPNRAPPPGHIVAQHPDWLLADATGSPMSARDLRWWQADGVEGYYLSPCRREVRAHTAALVAELAEGYALDGVHLDYVRYPSRAFGLDPEHRTAFALHWGVDPAALVAPRGETSLAADTRAFLDSVSVDWRAGEVDSLVAAVRAAAPRLAVSAAVVPDPEEALREKGQNWVGWLRRGLVDFVVPMAYNDAPAEAALRARVLHNIVGDDRFLMGIALHDDRYLYLPRLVTALREAGVPGFSVFSYNVLAQMRYPVRVINESFFTAAADTLTEGDDAR